MTNSMVNQDLIVGEVENSSDRFRLLINVEEKDKMGMTLSTIAATTATTTTPTSAAKLPNNND